MEMSGGVPLDLQACSLKVLKIFVILAKQFEEVTKSRFVSYCQSTRTVWFPMCLLDGIATETDQPGQYLVANTATHITTYVITM